MATKYYGAVCVLARKGYPVEEARDFVTRAKKERWTVARIQEELDKLPQKEHDNDNHDCELYYGQMQCEICGDTADGE